LSLYASAGIVKISIMPEGKCFSFILYEMVEWHLSNFQNKRGEIEWNGQGHGHPGYWFDVDVNAGRYKFDCHGFVRYMINDAFNGPNWRNDLGGNTIKNYDSWKRPMKFIGQLKSKPWNFSGSNDEWWKFGEDVNENSVTGWKGVTMEDLRRGDILITEGHVMIAMSSPDKMGQLLIADSSGGHKGEDHRADDKDVHGMGKGKIRVEGNMTSWTLNGLVDRKTHFVRLV
jgi:hypothetical protein